MSLDSFRTHESEKINDLTPHAKAAAQCMREVIERAVSTHFAKLNEKSDRRRSQPIVYTRVKGVASALRRIEERYRTLENLPDFIGCRIVVTHVGEVDEAKGALEGYVGSVKPVPVTYHEGRGRSRGYSGVFYSKIPVGAWLQQHGGECVDENLKEAALVLEDYHFEIQVHTAMEEAWSRLSHAGFYKNDAGVPKGVHEQLTRMAAVSRMIDEELNRISLRLRTEQEDVRNAFMKINLRAELPIDEHILVAAPELSTRIRDMFIALRAIGQEAGLRESAWVDLVRVGDETDICLEVCQRTGLIYFKDFEENIEKFVENREVCIDVLRRTFFTDDGERRLYIRGEERRGSLTFDRPLTVFALLKLLELPFVPSIDTMKRELWMMILRSPDRLSKGIFRPHEE